MNIIYTAGQEESPPAHDEGYFPEWHTRRIEDTFTGCEFVCHITETSDALLSPTRYLMKIVTKHVHLGTALVEVKNSTLCDCEFARKRKKRRVYFVEDLESAAGQVRAMEGRGPFKVGDTYPFLREGMYPIEMVRGVGPLSRGGPDQPSKARNSKIVVDSAKWTGR